jgi:hypothetical protein
VPILAKYDLEAAIQTGPVIEGTFESEVGMNFEAELYARPNSFIPPPVVTSSLNSRVSWFGLFVNELKLIGKPGAIELQVIINLLSQLHHQRLC